MGISNRRQLLLHRVGLVTSYTRAMTKHEWCPYCGKKLGSPLRRSTIDHIHPQSAGGKRVWYNETMACVDCNHAKADKSLLDFLLHRNVSKRNQTRLRKSSILRLEELSDLPEGWKDPLATLGYVRNIPRPVDRKYMGLGSKQRKVLRAKLAGTDDS